MGGRRTQPASSGPSPVISCLLFEALLDAFSASVGWKCARGESEGICAYHTSLSSRRQESAARGSVGESTCIQNAEERTSKRNGARMVGGREGEKKLAPARHPVSGRFWSFSQEGSIVLDTSSSLYLRLHMHNIHALFLVSSISSFYLSLPHLTIWRSHGTYRTNFSWKRSKPPKRSLGGLNEFSPFQIPLWVYFLPTEKIHIFFSFNVSLCQGCGQFEWVSFGLPLKKIPNAIN